MGIISAPTRLKTDFMSNGAYGLFLGFVSKEKARRHSNTRLWNKHQGVADNLKEEQNANGKDTLLAVSLNEKKKSLSAEILAAHRAENIYANADEAILQQLIRNERVHAIVGKDEAIQNHHIQELKNHRLGSDEGLNKRARALILDCKHEAIVLSQIFSMDVEVATDENQKIIRPECPGDLDLIKTTEPVPLTGRENIRTYWTISANPTVNGAGSRTINSVSADTPNELAQITTSPNHQFVKAYGLDVLSAMDDAEFYQTWNEFMATGRDDVMEFHQKGKGAYKGYLHINPDSIENRYSTNNVYVPSMMAEYKASAGGGRYAVSDIVCEQFTSTGHGQYVVPVEDLQFAPIVPLS